MGTRHRRPAVVRIRSRASITTLDAVATALVVVLVLFVAFDLAVGVGRFRWFIVGVDSIALALALGVMISSRRRWLGARHAEATMLALGAITSTITAVSTTVTGNRAYVSIFVLEIIAAGAVFLNRSYFSFFLVYALVAWGGVCARTLGRDEAIDYSLVVGAAGLLSLALFHARGRSVDTFALMVSKLESGRREVRGALQQARAELSERRKAEAERVRLSEALLHSQKMEAIGNLAGGVAHDINNVLMAIYSSAELVKANVPADSPILEDVDTILRAAYRGSDFTKNLLGFARRGKHRVQDVDPLAVIRDIEKLLSHTLPRGIVFSVDAKRTPFVVRGDASQLGHAIMNLLINASEGMGGRGRIEITMGIVELDAHLAAPLGVQPGTYYRLDVSDEGPGIAQEHQARIFEPFFTTKPVGQGTGLGLAMVYGTVTNHGGAVTFTNRVPKGATFSVYLPAREASAVDVASERSTAASGMGTVLVVDDERLALSAAARLLRSLGYSTLLAEGGEEALKHVRTEADISAVLLDMSMPTMDGPECYRLIREMRPEIPVIICSGYAKNEASEALLSAGARGFLSKPYTRANLGEILDSLREGASICASGTS